MRFFKPPVELKRSRYWAGFRAGHKKNKNACGDIKIDRSFWIDPTLFAPLIGAAPFRRTVTIPLPLKPVETTESQHSSKERRSPHS
jgi:hypothetical protein